MNLKKYIMIDLLKYAIIPFVIYLVIDYINIPSLLGIRMVNVSYDLLNTLLNMLLVVILYIISYRVIDKRQIDKDDNAKQTTNILLQSSYKKCVRNLNIIDNQQLLEQYVIPKIDFDKAHKDCPIVVSFQDSPFLEYEYILSLAENGAVEKTDLLTYLEIEDLYKGYISNRITFFDIDKNARTNDQMELRAIIARNREDLRNKLDEEIQRLDRIIGGDK